MMRHSEIKGQEDKRNTVQVSLSPACFCDIPVLFPREKRGEINYGQLIGREKRQLRIEICVFCVCERETDETGKSQV